jgi:hypothetical protein
VPAYSSLSMSRKRPAGPWGIQAKPTDGQTDGSAVRPPGVANSATDRPACFFEAARRGARLTQAALFRGLQRGAREPAAAACNARPVHTERANFSHEPTAGRVSQLMRHPGNAGLNLRLAIFIFACEEPILHPSVVIAGPTPGGSPDVVLYPDMVPFIADHLRGVLRY